MSRSLVVPLLAAAALVYACGGGPRPHAAGLPPGLSAVASANAPMAKAAASRVPGAGRTSPAARRERGDTAALEVQLRVAVTDRAEFALQVINRTDRRLELDFPDGQTREFAVYDAATGREVWRWSKGRLFTQVMQNKLLVAGDSVTYAERWDAPTPGRYRVVATLRSENHPVARTALFEVQPAAAAAAAARGPATFHFALR
jgi:hypothetical protein